MSWLARLKNLEARGTEATKPTKPPVQNLETPGTDATKATKPPVHGGGGGFVGFVACHPGHSENIEPAHTQTSRWWLIHYPDRSPEVVACYPEATHADILELYPDAVAAEPFTPATRKPTGPMTASEEAAIRAWLALIEETDPATIAQVIDLCQRDADARDYFTGRAAAELPKPDPFYD